MSTDEKKKVTIAITGENAVAVSWKLKLLKVKYNCKTWSEFFEKVAEVMEHE